MSSETSKHMNNEEFSLEEKWKNSLKFSASLEYTLINKLTVISKGEEGGGGASLQI